MIRDSVAANKNILVVEAQAIGMIGVIRSLGRAGYRVHAASMHADAPGFASRYAGTAVRHPGYADPAFLPWLQQYIAVQQIAAIVPSEAFLLAIAPHYEQFRSLLPDAGGAEAVYRCFAKADVEAYFAQHANPAVRAHLPKAIVVQRDHARPDARQIADWQWPLYVKTDGHHADAGHGSSVRAVADPEALQAALAAAMQTHQRCQVQETVPGVKATVNLWRHRGEFRAASMCVAMHENPHTGGLTAYRKLWWHDAMFADAKCRLEALDWNGVAMVEYKYDASSGRFWFLELNARYWNALNLDLLAGKDFPRWQLDAHFGAEPVQEMGPGRLGFRARYTVPADVGYVMSRCRDSRVSAWQKLKTVAEFFLLAVHPAVHSDLWFPGDRGLYWRAWRNFLGKLGRSA